MVTYSNIANLFFVIVNNISYKKLEVEKIVDNYPIYQLSDSPIDQLIWLVNYLVTWLAGLRKRL